MRYYFWLPALVVGLIACAESINHDENLAAKRAAEFAQIAFVKQDVKNSYALLSDAAKRYVSQDKFKETVARLHPGTYPTSIVAMEYEPMSGEKAIYIYVSGENSADRFYYMVTMEGAAGSDYRVSRFARNDGPYAPSHQKKKLSAPDKQP